MCLHLGDHIEVEHNCHCHLGGQYLGGRHLESDPRLDPYRGQGLLLGLDNGLPDSHQEGASDPD